jgi:alcohol dehydrogenase
MGVFVMNEFKFGIPQNIFFGQNTILKLTEILAKIKSEHVFIISGPNLNKIGIVNKIENIVTKSGRKCSSFTETEANPSVETVDKAVNYFKESNADCIIAIGGGSPIDVAKAVGVVAKYGGSITDYEGGEKVEGEIVPLIAIPTTAGTGSEVTEFSVITDHSRNYKLTVFSNNLLPQYVILDPNLISSVPPAVAASTGMDAMVHAIEAYISKASNPFTDSMAEKALELLGKNIKKYVEDRSDIVSAEAMLLGSTFAGFAFNFARLGNVHAMAHPVSGYFDVPHGVANAILLPVCLEYNRLEDKGKYRKIYDYISINKSSDDFESELLVELIRELINSIGLPSKLSEVLVTDDKIEAMAIDAMKSGNILVNPRNSTKEDIENLYRKAM